MRDGSLDTCVKPPSTPGDPAEGSAQVVRNSAFPGLGSGPGERSCRDGAPMSPGLGAGALLPGPGEDSRCCGCWEGPCSGRRGPSRLMALCDQPPREETAAFSLVAGRPSAAPTPGAWAAWHQGTCSATRTDRSKQRGPGCLKKTSCHAWRKIDRKKQRGT